jgi:L-threonylcarbamoyladenylate synthase
VKLFRAETINDAEYEEILSLLRNGGVMAFPTDTAYGLGADPFNTAAIDRIFEIKGRSEQKPILLLVDSIQMANSVTMQAEMLRNVADRFWPGPLTLIARAAGSIPANVTAGTGTVGVRWPVAPFAAMLIARFGRPITATSANRSGQASAITADEVQAQLGNSVDIIVDGGELPSRSGSTLLDVTVDPAVVLREGPVTFDTLKQFFKGRIRRQVA